MYRGDHVESVHRVSAAVCDARGELWAQLGDPHLVTCLRSAAKPFQALPLLAGGGAERFGLDDDEVAILCASHNGEQRHLETAAAVLRKAGLDESALRCGAHPPYHAASAAALGATPPRPLHNNCSGKHAGFLAACVLNGWPTESYLDLHHPLQREVLRLVARYSGLPADKIGAAVDGCGAPAFFLPLSGFARAFAHLARPAKADPEHRAAFERIAEAMTRGAWFVGGTGRLDTDVMGAAEGRLVSKTGGEAIHALADRETGRALVVKVEDGNPRARDPAVVEAARQLGWLEPRALEVLGDAWRPTLTNWAGRAVGRVEPAFTLAQKGLP